MRHRALGLVLLAVGAALLPAGISQSAPSAPTTPNAPLYARIALLRPNEGQTVDFEAGYIRHLEWHRQASDPWVWYGWTIWAGDRQRWFVYATFSHAAADFDHAVAPAEDERDNVANVVPHAQFVGNGIYEYLPDLSRGTGTPSPAARLELTTVELAPGSAKAFEAALGASRSGLTEETLWYRMVAGGAVPRYVRLRPRPSLAAILERSGEAAPPALSAPTALPAVAKATVEILTLRPTMSHGLSPARP
jgi:hypothetical protein